MFKVNIATWKAPFLKGAFLLYMYYEIFEYIL